MELTEIKLGDIGKIVNYIRNKIPKYGELPINAYFKQPLDGIMTVEISVPLSVGLVEEALQEIYNKEKENGNPHSNGR